MPHSAARLGLLLSVTVVCLTASVWGSADELALQGVYVIAEHCSTPDGRGKLPADDRPV